MAPVSRSRASRATAQQPTLATAFGRVTKSSKLNSNNGLATKKVAALEQVIVQVPELETTQRSNKRRRASISSDDETPVIAPRSIKAKRLRRTTSHSLEQRLTVNEVKTQQPTPPRSPVSSPVLQPASATTVQNDSDDLELPITLQDLVSLHSSLVRAISIHHAHHGLQSTAPLSTLLPSMTKLWRKSTVTQVDIERVLAVWEVRDTQITCSHSIQHAAGPFKLSLSGVGSNACTVIEYTWTTASKSFDERLLQEKYESHVRRLYFCSLDRPESFLRSRIDSFPRLTPTTGAQTTSRQERATNIRNSVLNRPTQLQAAAKSNTESSDLSNLSSLSIDDPQSQPDLKTTALKSRTLSLFDRVRAKQLASASNPTQDAASHLRRRAIARIPDVVNVLRLKQSQKLASSSSSSSSSLASALGEDDFGGSRARGNVKVAFSMDQLVREIKDSIYTPVAPEEIRECISVIGGYATGSWCTVFTSNGWTCVTLLGDGPSGIEVKKRVEAM